MIQACLNGRRTREQHPAVPLTPSELAAQAAACREAGAASVHVHPRDGEGAETMQVGEAVRALRAVEGLEVTVSTGAWIAPLAERLTAIAAWGEARPDAASVNFSEDGAEDVCRALVEAGVRIEAGLATVADAERFLNADVDEHCVRVLVEVADRDPHAAVARARAVEATLDSVRPDVPRLLHGQDAATWAVVADGLSRGRDARIGLEDVLVLPDGTPAADNAALVRALRGLG